MIDYIPTSTPEKEAPKETVFSIESRVTRAKNVYARLDELMSAAEEQNPHFQALLEAAAQQEETNQPEQTTTQAMVKAAKKVGNSELKQYLEGNETVLFESEALFEKADSLAREEMVAQQDFLARSVDLGTLVQLAISQPENSEESTRPADLIKDAATLLRAKSDEVFYDSALPLIETAQHNKELLQELGVIRETPLSSPEQSVFSSEDLIKEYRYTFKASGLMAHSRQQHLLSEIEASSSKVDNLETLIKAIEKPGLNNKQIIPPALAAAFEQSTREYIRTLEEHDHNFITSEAKTRPTTPLISGLHHLKRTTGIEHPSEWVYGKLSLLPDWFTDGLGYIRFDSNSQTVNDERYTKHNLTAQTGFMEQKENSVNVSTFGEVFDNVDYSKDNYTLSTVYESIIERVIHSLIHEVSHYAHLQRIPLSALRDWVKVSEQESASFSIYANVAKEVGNLHGGSPLSEELAEDIAHYMTDPRKTLLETPQHFQLLQKWLKIYPQENIDIILSDDSPEVKRQLALFLLVPPNKLEETQALLQQIINEKSMSTPGTHE